MEQLKPTIVCMVVVFLIGVLASFSKATAIDQQLQTIQMDRDQPVDQNTWKLLLRDQLRKELVDLDITERMLLNEIEDLNAKRDQIRAQKRGHTQCFLNLVSCYRRRK